MSTYGKNKLAGKKAIVQADCHHLILRTSWVYGTRGENFVFTMLKLGEERESLRIVADQICTPIWNRMIAEAARADA